MSLLKWDLQFWSMFNQTAKPRKEQDGVCLLVLLICVWPKGKTLEGTGRGLLVSIYVWPSGKTKEEVCFFWFVWPSGKTKERTEKDLLLLIYVLPSGKTTEERTNETFLGMHLYKVTIKYELQMARYHGRGVFHGITRA